MHAIRKFSITLASTAILLLLGLELSLMGSPKTERINSGNPGSSRQNPAAPMMAMPFVAPLFLQDTQFSSSVSLVNASNVSTYATISLRSLSGQMIIQKQVPLLPSFPARIDIQTLLQEANSKESRGSIGGVPFVDPKLAVSSSTVFAGLPVGPTDLLGAGSYRPYVAIANFSLRPAHVTVGFSTTSVPSVGSNTSISNINLQPRSTKIVRLNDLRGDPGLRNSFVVSSDGAPGDVAVSMASKISESGAEVELLGKDAKQRENAGAHPWSIAHGNESTLLIFNHTDQAQRAMVTILSGNTLWEKLVKLTPFETVSLSLTELIKDQVKDDRQRTLPPRLVEGEVIWTMVDPNTTTGRMVVSNVLTAMARNFSCSPFTDLCGVGLSPSSATDYADGTSTTFDANPSFCLGYSTGDCGGSSTGGSVYPSYSWSGGDSALTIPASCSGEGACDPTPNSDGSATLTLQAQYYNCIYTPQAQVNVVGPPDHLTVIADNSGYPMQCQTTGIWVRQMKMQVVDSGGKSTTDNPSIAESFNPSQPSNSCGNGSPVPSPCAATTSGGQFIDTMAVSGNLCNSGISQSSGCGFSLTSTWSACGTSGSNTLWVSSRTTLSNGVSVDGHDKNTRWAAGTVCNSSGCH